MVNEAFINGDIVRWARERNGLTYAEIARPLKIQIDQIRSWEYGEAFPAFGKAQDLARLLRIPFGYLFLSKVPSDDSPIPDFRTVTDTTPTGFSYELNKINDNDFYWLVTREKRKVAKARKMLCSPL